MLNLDTHILVYLISGDLTEAEISSMTDEDLAISDVVLWEIAKLIRLKKVELDLHSQAFQKLLSTLTVIPINLEIARISTALDFRGDPADEIIAATSVVENIRLMTRDAKIHKSKIVPFA
jgi:PIN domain nuclease of toxin-antitoxin system